MRNRALVFLLSCWSCAAAPQSQPQNASAPPPSEPSAPSEPSQAVEKTPMRRNFPVPEELPAEPSSAPTVAIDDEEISLAFPEQTRPCFLYPAARYDASACGPSAKAQTAMPPVSGQEWVAMGLVSLPGAASARAMFTLTYHVVAHAYEPFPGVEQATMRGAVDALKRTRPDATLWPEHPRSALAMVAGHIIALGSFDADNVGQPLQEHTVMVTFASQPAGSGRIYALTLNTVHGLGGAADATALRVASTIRVRHPAPIAPTKLAH